MAPRLPTGLAVLSLAAVVTAQEPFELPPQLDDFVRMHCFDCHGGDTVKGRFDLSLAPTGPVDRLARLSSMRQRVLAGEMPPPPDAGEADDGPAAAERSAFADAVEQLLAREVPMLPADPGRVTVRRLSRAQWQNTVRDLLGVAASADGFPADDLGYGFDSIGDALSFSTLHLEKYLAASRQIAGQVFHGEDPEQPVVRRFRADAMHLKDGRGATMGGGTANLITNATLEQRVRLPRDGVYRIRIEAGATKAGDELAQMVLALDGRELERFEVDRVEPRFFELTAPFCGADHTFALSFVNDFHDPKNADPARRDRNLRIAQLEVIGPIDVLPVPPAQVWLHEAKKGRGDVAQLRSQIAVMLPRLWRRPVAKAELQRVQRAAVERLRAGEAMAAAQRFALTVALTSPNFLFRIEDENAGEGAVPVAGAELATRLSYFLWASAPDAELTRAGRGARLQDDAVLVEQVDRLLQHERAASLATDFAAQWLELRALDDRTPDPSRFPGFDAALRAAFRRESELLFLAVMRDGLDVRQLLDCDFTHVDATLAAFYGLPYAAPVEATAAPFVRVTLTGDARLRGGLLGHASVHAVTSNPTRTSPVKRGKWILENLLDQPPPPPPPGNDSFRDEAAIDSAASLRVQMAQHRSSSKCAVCHVRMDALGFALERFDVIGRYREQDGGGVIDASGELPDGTQLAGLADLKRVLARDPAFVHTLAHKLFVYAVGRDLRPVDRLRVDAAVRALTATGQVTVRDLVLLVVRDVAFRQRAPSARD